MSMRSQSHSELSAPSPVPGLEGLLARAAHGEEAAFAQFYQATSPRVFGLALRILRERSAAEDITCEVFTQVWQKVREFDPYRGTAIAWLLTMARTRAIDRLRQDRRVDSKQDVLETALEVWAETATPEQNTLIDERAVRVRTALAKLPAEQREAISISFFGGLSHSETAETLGAPLGTVKTRIRAGLAALRRELAGTQGTQA
jgi:RNA polymerase sigma-70 factor (ECF subfamily)